MDDVDILNLTTWRPVLNLEDGNKIQTPDDTSEQLVKQTLSYCQFITGKIPGVTCLSAIWDLLKVYSVSLKKKFSFIVLHQ